MSRLDSFIRRLEAQRACLNTVANAIGATPGYVLELGLGNGRTYDHLREILPDREIFVFEREVRAHPDCIPDVDHLIPGDIETSLPAAASRFADGIALIHSDIGTGDQARNQRLASWLAGVLPGLLTKGGWIVADQAMSTPHLEAQPLPAGIAADRYFIYRRPLA